ncbi:MAG TPA: RNA polymerase sigma factor [Planctomycetota bacterium]|nr:RNA polymerase sigma factor [Planctomycetota bacterium]
MLMITSVSPAFGKRAMPDEQNDAPQFSAELETCRAELLKQAQFILGSREDAEDCVQETLLEASQKKRPTGALLTWLRSINRANAIDSLRARQSQNRKTESRRYLLPEDTFTTGGFSRLELRDSLEKSIAALPAEMQRVIRLRYYQHQSYKQIAETMGMPIGTVSGILMDAFAMMYAKLGEHLSINNAAHRRLSDSETQKSPIVGDQIKPEDVK